MCTFKSIFYLCLCVSILCPLSANAAAVTCVKPFAIADTGQTVGSQVTLKPGVAIVPGWYGALDLDGGGGGAEEYRENIAGCNAQAMQLGDELVKENGNMVGPTKQGIEDLMGLDPNAYWDTRNLCVVTAINRSPRIFLLPLYDPEHFTQTGQVRVTSFASFFVEAIMGGKEVIGRFTTSVCLATEPDRETTCDDGRDNDGDGAIDCEDSDCSSSTSCQPA